MGFLFEGLGYSFLIVFKLIFWPVVILGGITLIIRGLGAISRAAKDKKKKK